MKVLYKSEITGKLYDSEKELGEAEKEVSEAQKREEAKKAERAAAAKEVENLLKEASDAHVKAQKALADFCDKYGSFKTTLKGDSHWMDWIFDPWKMLAAFNY